jgi:Protein of unknown function (DUF2690)
MSLTLRRVLIVAFAALSMTVAVGAAPTFAASATPDASQSGCTYNNAITLKSATLTHGNEVRKIELRYSTSSQCVWARLTNGQVGDYMWVWNKDTGALRSAYITSGHDNYTDAIHDNGTLSHACMEPVYDRSIKVCTGFA